MKINNYLCNVNQKNDISMTQEELKKRIEDGTLETRGFGKVRNITPCYQLNGRKMYEVFVQGISWCIGTVYADNGKLEDDEINDEDIIY